MPHPPIEMYAFMWAQLGMVYRAHTLRGRSFPSWSSQPYLSIPPPLLMPVDAKPTNENFCLDANIFSAVILSLHALWQILSFLVKPAYPSTSPPLLPTLDAKPTNEYFCLDAHIFSDVLLSLHAARQKLSSWGKPAYPKPPLCGAATGTPTKITQAEIHFCHLWG